MKVFHQVFLSVVLTLSSLGLVAQGAVDPGQAYFERGQFELAVQTWAKALSNISPEKNPKPYIDTSVYLAVAYQKLGRLKKAHKLLKTALPLAENGNYPVHHAMVLMHLSDVYLAMRDFKEDRMDCGIKKISRDITPFLENETFTPKGMINEASYYLEKSEKVLAEIDSDRKNYPLLWASILNRKGNIRLEATNILARRHQRSQAQIKYHNEIFPLYEESINLIKDLAQPEAKMLRVKITINIVQGTVAFGNSKSVYKKLSTKQFFTTRLPAGSKKTRLAASGNESEPDLLLTFGITPKTVFQLITELPNSHDKAFLLISFAKLMQKWSFSFSEENIKISQQQQKIFANKALAKASKVANLQKDYRSMVYAWFERAKLYAQEQRYDEAIPLIRQAIFYTQNYPLLQTEFQKELWGYPGLLYKLKWHLGKFLNAQKYYPETPAKHQEAVETAYESAAEYLEKVRKRYGSLPVSFYKEEEQIYLEWAGVLLKRASKASGNEKQNQLRKIIEVVEGLHKAEIRNYFQDECITKELQEDIHVAIPKGVVVLYPLLFDNRIELLLNSSIGIQQITVRTGTRVDFMQKEIKFFKKRLSNQDWNEDVQKIANKFYKWFIEPISEFLLQTNTLVIVPHKDVHNLPFPVLSDDKGEFLIQKPFALAFTPSVALINFDRPLSRDNLSGLLSGSTFKDMDSVDPLPNVHIELEEIFQVFEKKRYVVDKLENINFTFENIVDTLNNKAYSVLHCATHGKVDDNPEIIFSLTVHDKGKQIKEIRLKQLKDVFKRLAKKFDNRQPIELITLSACDTATGKLILGLAGMLLSTNKSSGIPSSLGTLWPIEEKSSGMLMAKFYHELLIGGKSKAEALQEAQRDFLTKENTEFKDPYYWVPYLIIGNFD